MSTPDTPIEIDFNFDKHKRQHLIDEGQLIDISEVGKRVGLNCKAAVTMPLFNNLFPFAEDAIKGVSWDEIVADMLKLFRKETKGNQDNYVEFAIIGKTYVKEVTRYDQVHTFKDGKARDKRMVIGVGFMPDEQLNPSLIFTLRESKFLS